MVIAMAGHPAAVIITNGMGSSWLEKNSHAELVQVNFKVCLLPVDHCGHRRPRHSENEQDWRRVKLELSISPVDRCDHGRPFYDDSDPPEG